MNLLDEYLIKQTNANTTSEHAFGALFRAILEPVLEQEIDKIESDVVLKVTNRDMFVGLLTRLEFSGIQYVDYGRDAKGYENLEETDFLLVATSDFISFLAWKQMDDKITYICYTNTSEIDSIISLLDENAEVDLSYLKEKYQTKNYKTNFVTSCINKLAMMLNDSSPIQTEVIDNEDLSKKIEDLSKRARYLSHEIKNNLSICDLYSEIVKRYCKNNDIQDETILHSISCIDKSVKMAGNVLQQLKSINTKDLQLYKTGRLIRTAIELATAYTEDRNIDLIVENIVEDEIFVDATLVVSALINLIKNACEAFDDMEPNKNWIKISTNIVNDSVEIYIENNAKPIQNPDAIFDEGVTTKSTGSGLGLYICKKTIEEQCGQISLLKSDEDSTIFTIKFCL